MDNISTKKVTNQEVKDYNDNLKRILIRNLVIWELRYGAVYPHKKKIVHTYKEIATMYGMTDDHISVILARLGKRAKRKGGEK